MGAGVSRRPSLNITIALSRGITKSQILRTHIMDSNSNPHRKKVSSVKGFLLQSPKEKRIHAPGSPI